MMAVLGRQFQSSQHLIRIRANRNANQIIEEEATFGERIADGVASFGGSWTFIITFGFVLAIYAVINVHLADRAWGTSEHLICRRSSRSIVRIAR